MRIVRPRPPDRRSRHRQLPTDRRVVLGPRLLTWLAAVSLVSGAGAVASSPDAGPSGAEAWADRPGEVPGTVWPGVLRSLDRARSDAWRRGDPAALGEVYLPGSTLLREDRADLRAYTDRGLRVAGVSTAYDVVHVVSVRADSVRLDVVDRLAPSQAVSSATGRSRALPRDDVARHLITLRRTSDGWRIAAIRPVSDDDRAGRQ